MRESVQAQATQEASSRRERLRAHIERLYERGTIAAEDARSFSLHPTGLPRAEGEALRDLAIREGVRHSVETGFAYGLSALFLCEALLAAGGEDARHTAIDPLQAELFGDAGLRCLREAGVDAMVEFLREDSQLALPRLAVEGRSFDLAFIDGDHRFDSAFVDFYFLHRLVRPGGLIVVDDMWMPAVRTAAAFFETNLGYAREATIPQVRRRRAPWRRPARERMVVYRRPEGPDPRSWDHFQPFA